MIQRIMRLLPIIALMALASTAWSQTVKTDKDDYMPQEVAAITGTGFHAGEVVRVEIIALDNQPWADWWTDLAADDTGAINTTWTVPDQALGRCFLLTADCYHPLDANDPTPHLHAEWGFTDGATNVNLLLTLPDGTVVPVGTVVSVSYSGTNNGGHTQAGSVNLVPGVVSSDIGLKPSTSFTSTFPASIVVGGASYTLVGTTETTITSGASGDVLTVERKYEVAGDTTPPVISGVPANIGPIEATGPGGAAVSYGGASATDAVDGTVPVTYSPASGSTFALGTTTVNVTASDKAGNTATKSFTVTVVDTTAPDITVPANITAEATSSAGAAVSFTVAATDLVDGTVTATVVPASGSTFALGTTTVNVTATDAHGNCTGKSFTVTVQDTTAPVLGPTPDITAEAISAAGAVVTFGVTATDTVDANPSVTYSQDPGTLFPLGETTVTVTAKDASGNSATGSFKVNVKDTTPPVLSGVPGDLGPIEATGPGGAKVAFDPGTATDTVDPSPSVTASPASGSIFPLGATTVTVTATDASGNKATATFNVTVVDTTPPVLSGVPASIGPIEATGPGGAVVDFVPGTAIDTVDPNPTVSASPASGSTFPLGTTTVTVTAKDASGNACKAQTFNVTVHDTTPPKLGATQDITAAATSAAGAVVNFTITATDLVDQDPTVTCTPRSGSTFGFGTTVVSVVATDDSGNATTGSFRVFVPFDWSGILQPINADGSSIFKLGSTVPVKFRLTGFAAGITNGTFSLSYAKIDNNVEGSVVEAVSTSAATTGNLFRYDATAGQYIFNLGTKTMTVGTYVLYVNLGDGQIHSVRISLK